MKKLSIGIIAALATMAALVAPAEAKGPDTPPPPMEVVTTITCVNLRGVESAATAFGTCRGRKTMVVETTIYNPAGHAPKGLNK